LYFSGGGVERAAPGARYGGRIGDSTYYRVFASHLSSDDYPLANGDPALDSWKGWHGGVRVDSYANVDTQFTWQASASGARVDSQTSDSMNVNTLGRWTKRLSARSTVQAQLYFDRDRHEESARANTIVSTTDFSLHHTFGAGERNDVIWGAGYRHMGSILEQTNPFARVLDQDIRLELFSAFVQDEIKIVPHVLSLTVGTKIEHNEFTGFELQPSIRTVIKPTENQSVWAAISRAVRTPNVIEGMNAVAAAYGEPFPGPGGGLYIPTVVGNPDLESDVLWAYEAGYRSQLSKRVSVDLAVFQNNYRSMISAGAVQRLIPSVPIGIAELSWGNHTTGHTNGGEITMNVSPTASWRLAASYALLKTRFSSEISDTAGLEGSSPGNQATLRSFHDLSARMSVDTQLRYIGHINAVSAYIGTDVRLSYRLADQIEISIVGKNLLDRRHPEQAPTAFASVAEIPRSVTGKITWYF
jgi:iron complex outermembrane recepter protein